MIRWFLFFVISSLLVFGFTVFYRLGGMKPVEIREGAYPELRLFYKEHRGAYDKIAQVIADVEAYANLNNIPCKETFGEYFDDPRMVEERQLQSLGGCIVDQLPDIKDATNAADFKTKVIPGKKYVIATFTGAPSIGPLKVYPKVEEYMKEHNYQRTGSVIEIYRVLSKTAGSTEYLFTIEP